MNSEAFIDDKLWQVLTAAIGLIVVMLTAIIRKLFVSKADRAELNALTESIKVLREEAHRRDSEIVHELKEFTRLSVSEFKLCMEIQRQAIDRLDASNRLLTRQLIESGRK